MSERKSKVKQIIGIHEAVTLTKANMTDIPSKTDTGAYNSSIDCSFTEVITNSKGNEVLRYILLNPNNPKYTGKVHRTKKFKQKLVRSSNGTSTNRYQVKLKVQLKGEEFKTTFNLSKRSKMRYPILLGRKFLANRFLVDVGINRKTKT